MNPSPSANQQMFWCYNIRTDNILSSKYYLLICFYLFIKCICYLSLWQAILAHFKVTQTKTALVRNDGICNSVASENNRICSFCSNIVHGAGEGLLWAILLPETYVQTSCYLSLCILMVRKYRIMMGKYRDDLL